MLSDRIDSVLSEKKANEVQSLDLSNLQLVTLGDALKDFINLVELDLSGNKFETTAELTKFTKLEKLNLGDNRIATPDDLEPLTAVESLRSIMLKGCPIADDSEDYREMVFDVLDQVLDVDGEKRPDEEDEGDSEKEDEEEVESEGEDEDDTDEVVHKNGVSDKNGKAEEEEEKKHKNGMESNGVEEAACEIVGNKGDAPQALKRKADAPADAVPEEKHEKVN